MDVVADQMINCTCRCWGVFSLLVQEFFDVEGVQHIEKRTRV